MDSKVPSQAQNDDSVDVLVDTDSEHEENYCSTEEGGNPTKPEEESFHPGLPSDDVEQQHTSEDRCILCDNIKAPHSGKTELIAPCGCTDGYSKPILVHRSCHNQQCRRRDQKGAFGQCLTCGTNYRLQRNSNISTNKRFLLAAHCFRDSLIGIVVVQLLIALFGLLFWGISTAATSVGEDMGNNTSSSSVDDMMWYDTTTNTTANSTIDTDVDNNGEEDSLLLYDCETVRCVMGVSYVGGVFLFLICAGLFGCGVYTYHECDYGASIRAVGGDNDLRRNRQGNSNKCAGPLDCSGMYCDGDACIVILIVLAVMGIVVAGIGFLVGCFVGLVAIQSLVQRYLWSIRYRRLLEEYQVQDRRYENQDSKFGGGPVKNCGCQDLTPKELDRLKVLGLVADDAN